jgi:hypothetical protein
LCPSEIPQTELICLKPQQGGAITAEEGFKRKLTAILSADAVDYSRLMGEDDKLHISILYLH